VSSEAGKLKFRNDSLNDTLPTKLLISRNFSTIFCFTLLSSLFSPLNQKREEENVCTDGILSQKTVFRKNDKLP